MPWYIQLILILIGSAHSPVRNTHPASLYLQEVCADVFKPCVGLSYEVCKIPAAC